MFPPLQSEPSLVHHPFLQVALACPIMGGDQASMTEIVRATEALSITDLSFIGSGENMALDVEPAALLAPFTCWYS